MNRQTSRNRKSLPAGLCHILTAFVGFTFAASADEIHAANASAPDALGKVHIEVNGDDKQPLPCRIHIFDEAGKPQQAGKLPFWKDHFVCPGSVTLELPVGKYSFDIERGPEYERQSGEISIKAAGQLKASFTLKRIANLAADGWWSGDLHVHRRLKDIELLMRAEDLHVAPVITWWNNRNLWSNRQLPKQQLIRFDKNRLYHLMAGEDEREGGALLYFDLREPLPITGSQREYPSPMKFLNAARQQESKQPGRVWVDIEKPFWWDAPIWLASGLTDTIGLANNHMCRGRMYESEAWGRPRDIAKLPSPRGNGYWTQQIYYHILNCGQRVPPSAGSASGVLPNPVGYNRVYVHLGDKLNYDKWWQGLKAGRSFVTNGPLLLCRANGKLPGHVFTSTSDSISIAFDTSIITNDVIASLEVIKNGEVAQTIKFNDRSKSVSLEPIEFQQSGWFLVRAIADNKRTFRFASTAPFYVEIGESKHRISRKSVQFFIDWINERRQRVKLDDATQRRKVLQHHETALRFWTTRLQSANSE